jgi:DNA mismatch repair ATPase MutS
VPNDVRVGPPGTFLLVTGSNMSGKSTLLRALGMNVVLGSAGAPVCAAELRLPSVALHTSIRVQDSLEEGISLFMAELLSLSRIVAAARSRATPARPVLYLLDEVLQGTNSGDRRVAARTVLRHLLEAGAIGAVTTHDLSLAGAPDLEARAVPVHFSETAVAGPDGPGLTFDYLLKPGLATSRNALTLLEMVGLGPVHDG